MGMINSAWRGIKDLWFFLITAAIGALGVLGLIVLVEDVSKGTEEIPVVIIGGLVCLVAISFPILVIVERVRDHRFYRFLEENIDELAEGVTGPDGEVFTLETELVRYEANLNLIVLGACFESGLYRQGKGHRLPKLLYTVFSTLFGWWSTSWQDWIANATSIGHNLASTHHVTIGELFEPETVSD